MSGLVREVQRLWGISLADVELRRDEQTASREMIDLLLTAKDRVASMSEPWEYKSLADRAKENLCKWGYVESPQGNRNSLFHLSLELSEGYGARLKEMLLLVAEGLRLHVRDGHGFREGTDSDPDWHFARLMVERQDRNAFIAYSTPSWAEHLFIQHDNERIWSAIYGELPDTTDPEYPFVKMAKRSAVDALVGKAMGGGASDSSQYTVELRAALEAFTAVRDNAELLRYRTPKQVIRAWLDENYTDLSKDARDRISTVVNWQPSGGAPKSPAE